MTRNPQPSSGCFEGSLHLFPVRVYYEDTDLSGIVYHANYLRWMERARSDMLRLLDIDQRAAIEEGEGADAVAEVNLRHLAPARLDDALLVRSRTTELRAASARIEQSVLRGEDVLADASIRVGFVSLQGRPKRQPAAWREAFQQLAEKGLQ